MSTQRIEIPDLGTEWGMPPIEDNQGPDFYSCIAYEFNEIRAALASLNEQASLMRSNFDGRHDVALKLSLEMFAKKAEQARVMSNHLAGIMVRRINRKPRA